MEPDAALVSGIQLLVYCGQPERPLSLGQAGRPRHQAPGPPPSEQLPYYGANPDQDQSPNAAGYRRCGFFNAAFDHADGGEVHPPERTRYRRRMRPFDLLGASKALQQYRS